MDGFECLEPFLSSACPPSVPFPPLAVTIHEGRHVPLRRRHVKALVFCDHNLCDAEESLSFVADEDCQVCFRFPLPPRSVVHRLTAVIGDHELRVEVKPKAAAEVEFHEAAQQGHSAVQMKQEAENGIFKIDLGNLAAMEECVVCISYLQLLDSVASTLEWTHMSTWVPPYQSASDAVNRDSISSTTPRFAAEVAYTLSYEVHVMSTTAIQSLESPEAISVTQISDRSMGPAHHQVATLSTEVSDPGRDFSLLVELEPQSKVPSTLTLQRCVRGTSVKTVVLASFRPPKISAPAQQAHALNKELVLVVDCSGSMGGDPIDFAREAALYFVRDLPVGRGVKFQIICFGTRHICMNKSSKEYNAESEQHAVKWISSHVRADLGGTEIYGALHPIYETLVPEGYERQIIFMTDGGVSSMEEDKLVQLVKSHENARRTTLLCMGIGHGVHRSLLDKLASGTGGVVQYVLSSKDIVRTCSFLKRCALSEDMLLVPRLSSKLCMARMAPATLPPRLFAGQALHILAEITKSEKGAALELTARRKDGAHVRVQLPLPTENEDIEHFAAESAEGLDEGARVLHLEGEALAKMHAMAHITCLLSGRSALHALPDGTPNTGLSKRETAEAVKEQVVRLATEEGLVTPYTSAVGVMLHNNPLDPKLTKAFEVPLKVPYARKLWQEFEGLPKASERLRLGTVRTRAASRAGPSSAAGFPKVFKKASALYSTGLSAEQPALASRSRCGASMPVPEANACAHLAANLGHGAIPDMEKEKEKQGQQGALGTSLEATVPFPADVCSGSDLSRARLAAIMFKEGQGSGEGAGHGFVAPAGLEAQKGACPRPSPTPPQASSPESGVTNSTMLSRLNLARTTEGFWPACRPLLEDLLDARATQAVTDVKDLVAEVLGAKPAPLAQDAWTTVLCIAYLRRHQAADKPLWQGMEAKALAWLQAGWPKSPGTPSIGSAVLAAMKLL